MLLRDRTFAQDAPISNPTADGVTQNGPMFIASLPTAAPSSPPFPATGGPSTGVTGDVAAGPALAPQLDASDFEALVQGTPTTKIGATKVAVADSKTQLPSWPDGAPGSDLAQALAASLSIQVPQPLAPQTVAPSDAGPVGGGSPTTAALSLAVPFAPRLATAKSGVIASPEPSAQAEAPSPAGDQSPTTAAPTVVIPFAPTLAAAKSGLIADPKPSAQTDRPGPAGSESATTAAPTGVVPFAPTLATAKPELTADPNPSAQTDGPAPAGGESSTTAAPTGVVPFAPTLATAKPGFLADTAPSAQTGPPGSPSSPAIARQRAPADPAAIGASVLSPRPASRVKAAAASAARPI
ncbi:MAG TPA: hypothetical protein VG960_08640, partial [Caulobacteraceae bacterium]|nr:hypothetical protein [Caulobacteraceae bacterium]